jgi:hypothetical protein
MMRLLTHCLRGRDFDTGPVHSSFTGLVSGNVGYAPCPVITYIPLYKHFKEPRAKRSFKMLLGLIRLIQSFHNNVIIYPPVDKRERGREIKNRSQKKNL